MVSCCGSAITTFHHESVASCLAYVARAASCAVGPPCFSFHRLPANVAKLSLSQMSFQSRTETASPNHWCASSCAIVLVLRTSEYSGRVWVSREKPIAFPLYVARSAIAPVESKAYLPNVLD